MRGRDPYAKNQITAGERGRDDQSDINPMARVVNNSTFSTHGSYPALRPVALGIFQQKLSHAPLHTPNGVAYFIPHFPVLAVNSPQRLKIGIKKKLFYRKFLQEVPIGSFYRNFQTVDKNAISTEKNSISTEKKAVFTEQNTIYTEKNSILTEKNEI